MSWSSSELSLVTHDTKQIQRVTERVIREHSKTFYFATSLLPGREKRAVRALYAFCRSTDDLVDRTDATMADVETWREQVALEPEQQTNPLLYTWAVTRRQFGVDRRYEQELINGVGMDIRFEPYKTWNELQNYCYRVASTVGLLSIPIIGLAPGIRFEQAEPFAAKLGIALQMTNILRDISEDASRGRVYLPLEELSRFDLSLADIHKRVFDERFIRLMKFQIERARHLYQQALPGIALLARRVRLAVGAAALLYAAILDEIEDLGYDVYHQRAYTHSLRKIRMLPGIIYRVLTLRPPAV
jgi:15-cis-phytoene synthase